MPPGYAFLCALQSLSRGCPWSIFISPKSHVVEKFWRLTWVIMRRSWSAEWIWCTLLTIKGLQFSYIQEKLRSRQILGAHIFASGRSHLQWSEFMQDIFMERRHHEIFIAKHHHYQAFLDIQFDSITCKKMKA